jgi:phosphoglycolate phosphatase-like HAD superfamily hydrolase
MLCSRCSEVVKPIVAIDIDGTLGDYHTHFLKFAENYLASYHRDNYGYRGYGHFRDWFCTRFDVDVTTFRQIKLAYRQGAQKRSMPVYDGAAALVRTLRQDGTEVWLTTTRPYLRLDNVDPDTRFWLERKHIDFDGMLYDEDKYKVLAERVGLGRVVAVVDDLLEQCSAAAAVFGDDVPIHRLNEFNVQEGWRDTQADTLREIYDIIKPRVKDWIDAHVSDQTC